MVSFRYHVVTIIAIFLALALGVVAGTTVLNQRLVKDLRARTVQAEHDVRDLRAQLGPLDAFVDAAVPYLVQDRLAGEQIILLTHSGVDGGSVAAATSYLQDAGANVVSMSVTTRMALKDEGARKELTDVLGLDIGMGRWQVMREAALKLADRLVSGPRPDDLPPTGEKGDLLENLLLDDFLEPGPGPGVVPGDVPHLGGDGQPVVVVGGAESRPAISLRGFLVPLVQEMASHAGASVAAAEDIRVSDFSLVKLLRDDGELPDGTIVTVDDLGRQPLGGVALVLGLERLVDTREGGSYGVKAGADGVLPEAA